MSLWQFTAAIEGWNRANTPPDKRSAASRGSHAITPDMMERWKNDG